jgi:hypothetical protein
MARKVILETNFVFNPTTRTVTLGRYVKQERLALITNVTKNIVIYNFSDPNLKATAYNGLPDVNVDAVGGGIGISSLQVIAPVNIAIGQFVRGNNIVDNTYVTSITGTSGSQTIGLSTAMTGNAFGQYTFGGTVVTLNYNTSLMGANDKLQIVVDEFAERFEPAETFQDPVSKMRMSTPQSLIDADFEYGLQPTKWEVLQLVNNRPAYYTNNQTPLPVVDVTATNGSKALVLHVGVGGGVGATISTSSSSTTVTGTNTNFNQQTVPVGSVLFQSTTNAAGTNVPGTLLGTVSSVTSTTQVILANNANATYSGAFFFTPGGFNITGAVATGTTNAVYTGTIVAATNSTSVTGVNTNFQLIQAGFSLYTVTGQFIGTVASTASNTSMTLLANAAQNVSGALYIVSNIGAGAPIVLQDTNFIQANTGVMVDSTSATNPCTLNLSAPLAYAATTGSILNLPLTLAFLGQFYSGSNFPNVSLTAPSLFASTTFTNSGVTVTGTTTGSHNFSVGTTIQITGTTATTNAPNGIFTVATVPTATTFTFTTTAAPTGSIGNGTVGSCIVTISSTSKHGLMVGAPILVNNCTATAGAPNGAWIVATIPSTTTLTFVANGYVNGSITGGQLYVRPVGLFSHRAFDGGVQMSTVSTAPGLQMIRQTRRVFRYQSGKGIQFSTGSVLKPQLELDSITSTNTLCTVTTKIPHSLIAGDVVAISNSTIGAYNGTYAVSSVTGPTTFTYVAGSTPSVSPAPGIPVGNVVNWYGATLRLGMFDAQNGFFWEYNGQTLNAVRRSSVDKLSGRVQVTQGSATVTGVGTLFTTQLTPGDYIVIRGQSYKVNEITNNTTLFISPEYRGTSLGGTSSAIVMKTVDYRVPQNQFNIDRLDGTGGSGYNIDLSKMQMFYADFAWYGAGAIRYGIKNQNGEVMYAHKITHANVKPKAYMRSGNLPARYEVSTIPPYTQLTQIAQSSDTTIFVNDTGPFPTAGRILVEGEYMDYTGKTQTSFTGITRGVAGGTSAATHAISTYPVSVFLAIVSYAPVISHWGSAVIMDGRFDDDKGYLFTATNPTGISIAQNQSNAIVSLRLGPTVDNGQTGLLGDREIINRAQLVVAQLGVYANGPFYVQLKLNSALSAGIWQNVGGSSLSQVCYHPSNTTTTGGETIYAFYANAAGGSTNFTATTQEFPSLRDLGNSIQGGGTTLQAAQAGLFSNIYPDGPDVLTVVATNIGSSSGTVFSRLSWSEAQA